MTTDYDKAHEILTRIGVTELSHLDRRICSVGDRLYLRAEGEPDCADLVGKINELCDRVGVSEGTTIQRVEVLAEKAKAEHENWRRYVVEDMNRFTLLLNANVDGDDLDEKLINLICERDTLRADLEAERAQLAAEANPVREMTPREIAESFALLCLTDREKAGRLLPKFSGLYSMVEDL